MHLTSNEFAPLIRLSRSSLLAYEAAGILPEPKRGPGGWRQYTHEDVEIALRILDEYRERRKNDLVK